MTDDADDADDAGEEVVVEVEVGIIRELFLLWGSAPLPSPTTVPNKR